jgi:hypothetical protein
MPPFQIHLDVSGPGMLDHKISILGEIYGEGVKNAFARKIAEGEEEVETVIGQVVKELISTLN